MLHKLLGTKKMNVNFFFLCMYMCMCMETLQVLMEDFNIYSNMSLLCISSISINYCPTDIFEARIQCIRLNVLIPNVYDKNYAYATQIVIFVPSFHIGSQRVYKGFFKTLNNF